MFTLRREELPQEFFVLFLQLPWESGMEPKEKVLKSNKQNHQNMESSECIYADSSGTQDTVHMLCGHSLPVWVRVLSGCTLAGVREPSTSLPRLTEKERPKANLTGCHKLDGSYTRYC